MMIKRALLLALLAIVGCNKAGGVAVVTVTASPMVSNVSALNVTATAGGETKSFTDSPAGPFTIPPDRQFAVEVPGSLVGTLMLHVVAADASQATLACGDAQVEVSSGQRADVTVT